MGHRGIGVVEQVEEQSQVLLFVITGSGEKALQRPRTLWRRVAAFVKNTVGQGSEP